MFQNRRYLPHPPPKSLPPIDMIPPQEILFLYDPPTPSCTVFRIDNVQPARGVERVDDEGDGLRGGPDCAGEETEEHVGCFCGGQFGDGAGFGGG